jgi:hypothetical protein
VLKEKKHRTIEHLQPEGNPTYWLTRFVILRLLGAVYAIAFLITINQVLPLIGSNGLLPLKIFEIWVMHWI